MDRRDFVLTGSAAALGAMASGFSTLAFAEQKGSKLDKIQIQHKEVLKLLPRVLDVSLNCAKAGEACAEHCQENLSQGHTDFATCSAAVRQMLVYNHAVRQLAQQKASGLSGILDAAISALKTCKEACLEHKAHFAHGMHLACKECAETCEASIATYTELKKAFEA